MQDINTVSFTVALLGTVSEAVGVPSNAVTGGVTPTRRTKRSLLAASTICTANLLCGMTSEKVISRLNEAFINGSFLAILRAKSGLNITGGIFDK